MRERVAILVGGSDLFSGARGISKGTVMIHERICSAYEDILVVNYNYFLDFGRTKKRLLSYIQNKHPHATITLYGYSKGGDVVLQLARCLEGIINIHLLVTVDIANGPWSHKVNRIVSPNVKKNINVYQRNPNFPLRSFGAPAIAAGDTIVENIDFTDQYINQTKINHGNIEWLLVDRVICWLTANNQAQ